MKCAITVPVYKAELSRNEITSLLRLKELFEDDVYFVGPDNLSLNKYKEFWPSLKFISFPSFHFYSIDSYNKFMLSDVFYKYFSSDYDWMLIHQLDAFLFHNDLEYFMKLDFDYYGAPWLEGQVLSRFIRNPYLLKIFGKKVHVGNGGLSLRKIQPILDLIKKEKYAIQNWKFNEDGFFAYFGSNKNAHFRVCPLNVACAFSSEKDAEAVFHLNNEKLPMGCHAFEKYEVGFYKEQFAILGYTIET